MDSDGNVRVGDRLVNYTTDDEKIIKICCKHNNILTKCRLCKLLVMLHIKVLSRDIIRFIVKQVPKSGQVFHLYYDGESMPLTDLYATYRIFKYYGSITYNFTGTKEEYNGFICGLLEYNAKSVPDMYNICREIRIKDYDQESRHTTKKYNNFLDTYKDINIKKYHIIIDFMCNKSLIFTLNPFEFFDGFICAFYNLGIGNRYSLPKIDVYEFTEVGERPNSYISNDSYVKFVGLPDFYDINEINRGNDAGSYRKFADYGRERLKKKSCFVEFYKNGEKVENPKHEFDLRTYDDFSNTRVDIQGYDFSTIVDIND